MKRPLCLLAILLTAAVYIYLELFLSDITGQVPDELDGTYQEVVGKVEAMEVRKNFSGQYLPVIYIIPTKQEYKHSQLIQCYMESDDGTMPEIGQYVRISGKVKVFTSPTNPGEFDSKLYYSSLKISYRLTAARAVKIAGRPNRYRMALYKVRLFFERALDRSMEEQDAAIMKAMILGDKAYMDEETRDMYKANGIMHILAVSALHVSIIGMGLYELLKRLNVNRVVASLLAIVFMYSYGVMCGMGTSSFRAILMFALRLLAPLLGRTYDLLSALALAEILLLLDQPLYLYNSGFLFSFGAVIGISVIRPSLSSLKIFGGAGDDNKMHFADEEEDSGGWRPLLSGAVIGFKEGILSGFSIMIATLPVYACFYYTYPLHSLVLNVMVIPIMGALMMMGIASMFLGAASGLLGFIPGIGVHLVLGFYRFLCSSEGLVRGFTWYMGHSDKWQVAGYIMLITLFVVISGMMKDDKWSENIVRLVTKVFGDNEKNNDDERREDGRNAGRKAAGRVAASKNDGGRDNGCGLKTMLVADIIREFLLVAAVVVLTFHATPELEIDMIDVGQGDGIVINCEGKHMLIDGGSTSKKNVGKYQIIPVLKYKGIGTLDAVVMSHEDEDHVSGIFEIMDDMEKGGIKIKQLILPEVAESSRGENFRKLQNHARELGIPIAYINVGESFGMGKAQFTCVNPELNMSTEGANAYSTVLYMKYGQFTALFTGDMEEEGLDNVKRKLREAQFGRITLLKVAHHGSQYTTDEEFLTLTNPRVALISCGRDNAYGHPHEELLERIDAIGAKVYRTDLGGLISATFDGSDVRLSEFLQE